MELPAGNAKQGPEKLFVAVKFMVNVTWPPALTVCVAEEEILDSVKPQHVLKDSVYAPGVTLNVSAPPPEYVEGPVSV